jgi:perosamine synthetase
MTYKFPVYQPSLKGNEKKYVDDCLDSTWISSKGKYIKLFEESFSTFTDIKYSIAVSNGTVALHLALLALGIGENDEVIVPTFTYVASVNAIKYVNANSVFVDSDPQTWQIDPTKIREKITKKTRAIMAVHIYGHPCDMKEIKKIAEENKLYIIEDCAEAIGSYYNNKHAGNFSDIATFSFFGNKTITTGEGGMVCTNDKNLHDLVIRLKGQGLATGKEYFHDIIGYNYRMTNICAAIGFAQLERISEIIKEKERIISEYKKALKNIPLEIHREVGNVKHSYWMFTVLASSEREKNELRFHLAENGIETRPAFHPVHTMPMYIDGNTYPVAEDLGRRGINLPSYPDLSNDDIGFITSKIAAFYYEKK